MAIAIGAIVSTAPLAPACSLGLDPSLIGAAAGDASVGPTSDAPVTPPHDGAASDAGADGPDAATCTKASDCVSTNACRVGTCTAGHCAYAVCPTTAACQGSSCTAASTCTPPLTYGFHAGAITISQGAVGCGGNSQACLATAYPFVFIGTTNGVVAYATSDPSNASPVMVPVHGLPFLPTQIVASGSRVYFLGAVAGVGPTTYKIAIGWIDVPSDPLASSLEATTIFATYPEPSLSGAVAGPSGSAFFLDDDSARFYPMALASAPIDDGAAIAFFPSPGIPASATPVIASGARVVVARFDAASTSTYFSLETGAGTGNAQNAGESSVASAFGPSTPQATYAQGGDGSVLWSTGAPVLDDAGTTTSIRAARLAWLVSDANATTFDGKTSVDVEVYTPPLPTGTAVAGPVAWVDGKTALVLAAANGATAQTSVQVAIKTPSPAIVQSRRYVVPVALPLVGAASSGGFGYVLANDGATTCTLHVFAPTCAE